MKTQTRRTLPLAKMDDVGKIEEALPIDATAQVLRNLSQAGRFTVDWGDLPESRKRLWLGKARRLISELRLLGIEVKASK